MKNMKPLLLFLFISISLKALVVSVTKNNMDAYSPTNDITLSIAAPQRIGSMSDGLGLEMRPTVQATLK
ncbi:hypothetical protein NL676_005261 [Syzygium grande]|nr:hypothetical protein NL676_005261 [Syzygium grande]